MKSLSPSIADQLKALGLKPSPAEPKKEDTERAVPVDPDESKNKENETKKQE